MTLAATMPAPMPLPRPMARLMARPMDDAPALTRAGLVLGGLSVAFLAADQIDPRTLDLEGVWLKPAKFAASMALMLLTLAWSVRLIPGARRPRRWLAAWSTAAIIAAAIEMAWVGGAAGSGLRSHYNDAQPFLVILYPVMGAVATVLAASAAAFGWTLLRHGEGAVARAAGWSFLATTALTVPVGFLLSGMPADASLPLGYVIAPGDLRPAHFLATHTMQVVPAAVAALSLLRLTVRGMGLALTAAWSALTILAIAYGLGLTGWPPLV